MEAIGFQQIQVLHNEMRLRNVIPPVKVLGEEEDDEDDLPVMDWDEEEEEELI